MIQKIWPQVFVWVVPPEFMQATQKFCLHVWERFKVTWSAKRELIEQALIYDMRVSSFFLIEFDSNKNWASISMGLFYSKQFLKWNLALHMKI